MNSQHSLVLLIIAMVFSMSHAHIGGMQTAQDVNPRVYCGRTLARALAVFCMDVSPNKRSNEGTMYNAILSPYYKEQENQAGWPWISHHKAREMGSTRGKRFVVNECCEKPCSLDELMYYC